MSTSRTDGHLFERTEFAGQISINGEAAPITFHVSAGSDCRLQINADGVNGRTYALVVQHQGRPGTSHEEFALTGTSADGKAISSQDVFVCGHGHNNGRRWIDLRSRACKITLPLERCVERPVLRLWFRSFRPFSNSVIETSFGRLGIWGTTGNVVPDDVSGGVALEAQSGAPGPDWCNKAEDFLQHMPSRSHQVTQ
jgi:hypothetical protein